MAPTEPSPARRLRIVGPGRAGGALAAALAAAGWSVAEPVRRGDDPRRAAHDVDLVVIATPDASIAAVAQGIDPDDRVVIAHLSGSLGLDVLEPHVRRAGLHPLVALPEPTVGAQRLRSGAWFGVAGDPMALEVVDALGGRAFPVDDDRRALYHAAACIASNHLVALLAHAERVAAAAGAPAEAYADLVRATVANVDALGPRAALTGPVARGDHPTVERHREALARALPDELVHYDAGVAMARRLAAEVDEPTSDPGPQDAS